jgi:hypothetical protein
MILKKMNGSIQKFLIMYPNGIMLESFVTPYLLGNTLFLEVQQGPLKKEDNVLPLNLPMKHMLLMLKELKIATTGLLSNPRANLAQKPEKILQYFMIKMNLK